MTKHFPDDVLKQGYETTVTEGEGMKVKAMLDTGSSLNNYITLHEERVLRPACWDAITVSDQELDLARGLRNKWLCSLHYPAYHTQSAACWFTRMHVTLHPQFGILKGLWFDMVIGLYAIALHFMEVIQDSCSYHVVRKSTTTTHACSKFDLRTGIDGKSTLRRNPPK